MRSADYDPDARAELRREFPRETGWICADCRRWVDSEGHGHAASCPDAPDTDEGDDDE